MPEISLFSAASPICQRKHLSERSEWNAPMHLEPASNSNPRHSNEIANLPGSIHRESLEFGSRYRAFRSLSSYIVRRIAPPTIGRITVIIEGSRLCPASPCKMAALWATFRQPRCSFACAARRRIPSDVIIWLAVAGRCAHAWNVSECQ